MDRWLAATVLVLAAVEVGLRPELPHRPLGFAFVAIIAVALLLRRRYPLVALSFGFGAALLTTLFELVFRTPKIAPTTSIAVLLLPYSLARWASRRHIVAGVVLVALTWLVALLNHEMPRLEDAIGSAVVLTLPLALGATFRFRAETQQRAVAQARLLEREQLARELHDSVAHHMMAITVQAQATGAILSTRPDAARVALAAIEDESKRALSELRSLVGALRDGGEAELSPAGRICDLPRLAERTARPKVEVELSGDLEALPPAVERAVFRVAQESITNAVKHARNATRITVRVVAGSPSIELSVRDDGETVGPSRGVGFGLVGMAERAALLGGTFEAGPLAQGGWQVAAAFPRMGKPS